MNLSELAQCLKWAKELKVGRGRVMICQLTAFEAYADHELTEVTRLIVVIGDARGGFRCGSLDDYPNLPWTTDRQGLKNSTQTIAVI